ncbi:hypothetical protein WA158_005692 [Blastocystis sp. Blastoise]
MISKLYRSYSSSILRKNVVITGMGLVTPLGVGTEIVWKNLVDGKNGIRALEDGQFKYCKSKVAGIVPKGTKEGEFDIHKYITHKYSQSPLYIAYALAAADEAMKMAHLDEKQTIYRSEDCCVSVGTGISNIEEIYNSHLLIENKTNPKLSPFFIPRILGNSPAGQISMRYDLEGGIFSSSTACAAGANAIAEGYRLIQENRAKMVLAGGTEMPLVPMGFHGFSAARSLSTHFNSVPERACRPFDKERDGFVMAEGAGILVLEEEEEALKRGYGYSSDAYNVTQPHPEGRGAIKAMRDTLSTMSTNQIGYVNAHATGTPLGDSIEYNSINTIANEIIKQDIYVSSTKGSTGHLLGAAGAIEAIFTVMALYTNILPPMIHLDEIDSNLYKEHSKNKKDYIHLIGKTPIKKDILSGMSNSFGFGGVNVCLGFEKYLL